MKTCQCYLNCFFVSIILERPVYFPRFGSMIVLPTKNQYVDFDISLDIRPKESSGMLVFTYRKKDYISIVMIDGYVESR